VFHGYMNPEILAGETQGGRFGEQLIGSLLINGYRHVLCLSCFEPSPYIDLHLGGRFLGRCLRIRNLSSVAIGIDGYSIHVAADDETKQAWGDAESHE